MTTSIVTTDKSTNGCRTNVSSSTGLISMLTESDPKLVRGALSRLLNVVDNLWYEVARALPDLESLSEDIERYDDDTRKISAAVASRVYFHLEEPGHALRLALEGGPEYGFDVVNGLNKGGLNRLYIECLVGAAVDAYVEKKRGQYDDEELQRYQTEMVTDDNTPNSVGKVCVNSQKIEEKSKISGGVVDLDLEKLRTVVYLMFERCYLDGTYNYALGVAIEAREEEKVKQILDVCVERCDSKKIISILRYALKAAINLISSKSFRNSILKIVAQYFRSLVADPNGKDTLKKVSAVSLCQAYQILKTAPPVADIVETFLSGSEAESILGLQLCFNLADAGDQSFSEAVSDCLQKKTLNENSNRFEKAKNVLIGGFASELTLSFLYRHSESDRLIMETLKKSLDERGAGRNSVLHNCAVMTHSYLNAGTTNDSFLRENLDWMKKASNWAKFSATASLGVVHAGYTTEAMTLLDPYLPQFPSNDNSSSYATPVSTSGGYAEGGSLYALGIIHGSHACSSTAKRKEANEYLRIHLRTHHTNEVISHGAALGVGLTALGSYNIEVVNELKELLYTDSAVAGESAGMAIGMVLVGSGAGNVKNSLSHSNCTEQMFEIVSELKNYARETQHEKIIRGIAIGIALINYGQEENADAQVDEMRCDRDPILRYGAQYALAMAYCGTGSNKAVRILLHTAVSDVSDDVRMAAVLALPFVLYRTPERVPQLVKLLLESFNPHIRYASCMAVGISMAGTGDTVSLEMLEPMLTDMTDFVRQGALLGSSMIYMQQGDGCNGKRIKTFRDKLFIMVSDKHHSTITKMGAILAMGIIDAGGRNCSLCLGSRNGFTKMTSAVGLLLWLQHWHWFPMMHMLSLALTPTITIGLNKDFKYPKNFNIQCNSKPSIFSYPEKMEGKKEEKKKRIETVTLSTTAKNNARLARKRAKVEAESVRESFLIENVENFKSKDDEGECMEVDLPDIVELDNKNNKKRRDIEPTFFFLPNPCRITRAQSHVCAFDVNQRYCPISLEGKPYGIMMLVDKTPEVEEDLGTVITPSIKSDDEADAPEAFEWTPPEHPNAQISGERDEDNKSGDISKSSTNK